MSRVALCAVGMLAACVPARAAMAGGIETRTEVREEVTTSATAATLFNPDGRVFVADSATSRLRALSQINIRLPASIAFKSINTLEMLNAPRSRPDLNWRLPEAYVRRPFGRAELSVGRKILRWTNGYAFSPAGLLDPVRIPSDPQDRLGQFEGRDMVALDFTAGSHTLSAVYSPKKILPGSVTAQENQLALRYHVVAGRTELSLMGTKRFDSIDTAAASATTVIGDALEIHAEAALERGSSVLLPRSSLRGGERTLYGADFYAPLRIDDGRIYLRWLVGLNYTLPNGVNIVAEYFHAPDGLGTAEWNRVLEHVRFSRALLAGGTFPPVIGGRSLPEVNLLLAMQPLGGGTLGQHYGFLRVARSSQTRGIEASVLAFANLGDGSLALVPELSFKVQRRVTAYGRATFPIGGADSEFGNIPVARAANFGFRVSF